MKTSTLEINTFFNDSVESSGTPVMEGSSARRLDGVTAPRPRNNFAQRCFSGQFFKTRMCKFYRQGSCTQGNECTYAHDENEIRNRPSLEKTSLCPFIKEAQNCPNKDDCPYAHSYEELRCTPMYHKTEFCLFFVQNGDCSAGANCRYAHSQDEAKEAIERRDDLLKKMPPPQHPQAPIRKGFESSEDMGMVTPDSRHPASSTPNKKSSYDAALHNQMLGRLERVGESQCGNGDQDYGFSLSPLLLTPVASPPYDMDRVVSYNLEALQRASSPLGEYRISWSKHSSNNRKYSSANGGVAEIHENEEYACLGETGPSCNGFVDSYQAYSNQKIGDAVDDPSISMRGNTHMSPIAAMAHNKCFGPQWNSISEENLKNLAFQKYDD